MPCSSPVADEGVLELVMGFLAMIVVGLIVTAFCVILLAIAFAVGMEEQAREEQRRQEWQAAQRALALAARQMETRRRLEEEARRVAVAQQQRIAQISAQTQRDLDDLVDDQANRDWREL